MAITIQCVGRYLAAKGHHCKGAPLRPSGRRRSRRDLLDLPLPHHRLDLVPHLLPLLLPHQLLHGQRKHIPRAAFPPDAPIDDRVRAALADVDESDGAALLFELADEAVRGEGREGGAGAEELGGGADEVLRVAARERFERLAEKDDALVKVGGNP